MGKNACFTSLLVPLGVSIIYNNDLVSGSIWQPWRYVMSYDRL